MRSRRTAASCRPIASPWRGTVAVAAARRRLKARDSGSFAEVRVQSVVVPYWAGPGRATVQNPAAVRQKWWESAAETETTRSG
jgi:hypothetical protein